MKSKEMSFGKVLFGTQGRINRFDWWAGHLIAFIIIKLLIVLTHYSIPDHLILADILTVKQITIGMLLAILYIWIHISLNIKRWHDINRPGWYAIFNYLPIVGIFVSIICCGFIEGTGEDNEYGEAP